MSDAENMTRKEVLQPSKAEKLLYSFVDHAYRKRRLYTIFCILLILIILTIWGARQYLIKESIKQANLFHNAITKLGDLTISEEERLSQGIMQLQKFAESESINISYYGIIYDLLDGVKEIIEGELEPEIKEEILGTAEVKNTFKSPKFGLIAGSMVIEGTIKVNQFVRVIRDDIVIFEGLLDSLRRFKDDASEVQTGTECGIGIENYSDVKVGDKIEVFNKKEIRRTLG